MDASAAAFQLAAILFILGVLFLALSVWLRLRWVSHPVDTAAVARTVRINLVGYALQLGGAIVFLAKVALPVATVLLVVSGTSNRTPSFAVLVKRLLPCWVTRGRNRCTFQRPSAPK